MKAVVVSHDDLFIGETVGCSLTWEGRAIDFSQVQKIHWALGSFPGGYIQLKDGSRIGTFRDQPNGRIKGHIVIRVASLNEDVTFDIRQIERLDYPYAGQNGSRTNGD